MKIYYTYDKETLREYQYEIFQWVLGYMPELNISKFSNPLRYDKHPGSVCFYENRGILYMKDFASSYHLDCFGAVMVKYSCSFSKSIEIINANFNIITHGVTRKRVSNYIPRRSDYQVEIKYNVKKDFQYDYWNQYGIEQPELDAWPPVRQPDGIVYVNKGVLIYPDLVYSYDYGGERQVIYAPNGQPQKWLKSTKSTDIYGVHDENSDLVLITKSGKDQKALTALFRRYNKDINVIAFQSETQQITLPVNKHVILNLDNDATGRQFASQYDCPKFFTDKQKDPSDVIKYHGESELVRQLKHAKIL